MATIYSYLQLAFQFTHPRRGATEMLILLDTTKKFQFTHPRRGATLRAYLLALTIQFQFTHPRRGATCG